MTNLYILPKMPIPRLLRRLSQKSLRKRTQSVDSTPASDDQKSSPPLPPPKTPTNDESYRKMMPSSNKKPQSRPSLRSQSLDGKQAAHLDGTAVTVPPPLPPPNGHNIGGDEELSAAQKVANKAPTDSKIDKALQKIENKVLEAQAIRENNSVVIESITTALDMTGRMEIIEQGVNQFMRGSTVLMKTLDEVAKLHPFVGVAILAFKAVWTLEMKRRENDKKIIALYVEMKNMMAILIQLKTVKDPTDVAPDGTSIKGRLQELARLTAGDIKACANTCDAYSRKKLIAKVIIGPLWEGKLLDFVGLFTKRRSEFEFALAIHTARGVDMANQTLGNVDRTTEEMNAKMDAMMKMFERFVLPEQREMVRLIEQKGGRDACKDSDVILKELSDLEQKGNSESVSATATAGARGGHRARNKNDFEDLKADIRIDPDDAIKENMALFSRKFEIQTRQIQEEVARVMKREGDRIIGVITSGPHDKILDPDVYKIWKEMNWRGSVKARHFVMCLRDYFQEKWNFETHPNAADGTEAAIPALATDVRRVDEWALGYLNVVRLRPISEAFDDDASGFVTVAEVNAFTSSRPLDWSLPHWIAYWAVGWHQTLVVYAGKIREIMGKMFAVVPLVRPENRNSVNEYILTVYEKVTTLQDSINICYISDALQAKFKSYVDAEEERLKANLEQVDYDIDAMDTLTVVTGAGRIEKFILPLLYLLLKRHFEIFRVSKKRIIHPDEMWDAADTMLWVFDAVYERMNVLETIFKHQKLDVKQHFKAFAHGLFQYWNEPSGLWAPAIVRESDPPNYPYNDELEEKDVKAENVCNYPLDHEGLDRAAYELTPWELPEIDASPLKAILGPWNGFIYLGEYSTSGMISFTLCPEDQGNDRFQASGRGNTTDFKISGNCAHIEGSDAITVSFKREFPARFGPQYWDGQFDPADDTITGTVSVDEDRSTKWATFVLKRISPEQLRFRPSPKTIEENKARALWTFALSASRAYVRQKSWSWSSFRERRDTRKRFIELYIRSDAAGVLGKPLNAAESAELQQIRQGLSSADSRFYHSLALYKMRITAMHERSCDGCHGNIGGSRIICLVCQTKDTWNCVDLCDAPECVSARVEREDLTRPHLPTHDLIKVRRVVHLRQFGQLERAAKLALEGARNTLGITENKKPGDDVADSILENTDRQHCIVCRRRVSQPCWYCVQCDDDSFICNECDARGMESFDKYQGAHDYNTHDLVRCQEPVEDVDASVEERLSKLEGLFADREKVMEDRLAEFQIKVDGRLARVEKLLEAMLAKMGVESGENTNLGP